MRVNSHYNNDSLTNHQFAFSTLQVYLKNGAGFCAKANLVLINDLTNALSCKVSRFATNTTVHH